MRFSNRVGALSTIAAASEALYLYLFLGPLRRALDIPPVVISSVGGHVAQEPIGMGHILRLGIFVCGILACFFAVHGLFHWKARNGLERGATFIHLVITLIFIGNFL